MEPQENTAGVVAEAAAPDIDVQLEAQPAEEKQEQHVPLSALQAERAQRQQYQEELKMMRDHFALMQAQSLKAQPQEKDEFEKLSDDDVLTVGEAKKFLSKMNKQYQMSIEELRMTQKHSDYQEVVTKYLPEVLKQNPGLRRSLEQTQDYELAYHLAKNSDVFQQDHKKSKKNADAEKLIQNSQKAGSLSSIGGTSPINNAKRWKDMPDDEFKKTVQKNLGYF